MEGTVGRQQLGLVLRRSTSSAASSTWRSAGPAANYWGGDRPGANLFANSVVAVDAETGKYKWHFQTVHHDLWDSDHAVAAGAGGHPCRTDGRFLRSRSVGKTGLMFILDRTNGKPIFGVEERPVPKGDVPGEWYSPTQPFPVKPPPLARVEFNKERDMVRPEDTSAQHVAACQDAVGQERAGSTTRDRLRRSCGTRTARRRRARFSFPAAPAA